MSNSNGNPIIADTVGNLESKEVKITSIKIIPSAANWACILTDNNNRNVFEGDSTVDSERSWTPAAPFKVAGLKLASITNVTRIYIYTTTSRVESY